VLCIEDLWTTEDTCVVAIKHWQKLYYVFHFWIFVLRCVCVLFLSASLYIIKRGAYWDRLCRDVVGRWLVVTRVHCGQMVHPRPIVSGVMGWPITGEWAPREALFVKLLWRLVLCYTVLFMLSSCTLSCLPLQFSKNFSLLYCILSVAAYWLTWIRYWMFGCSVVCVFCFFMLYCPFHVVILYTKLSASPFFE